MGLTAMTARVDFYLLKTDTTDARMVFGCRITQKAWSAGHRIFIQVNDDHQASTMDRLLWSFSQQSFVPHAVAGTAEASEAPVVIGTSPRTGDDSDLLVSLMDRVSDDIGAFTRVIEIVEANDQAKSNARERYRHYVKLGIEPNTHKV